MLDTTLGCSPSCGVTQRRGVEVDLLLVAAGTPTGTAAPTAEEVSSWGRESPRPALASQVQRLQRLQDPSEGVLG